MELFEEYSSLISPSLKSVFSEAFERAVEMRHEFVTPELVLKVIAVSQEFSTAFKESVGNVDYGDFIGQVEDLLDGLEMDEPTDSKYITPSYQLRFLMHEINMNHLNEDHVVIGVPQLFFAMRNLSNSSIPDIINPLFEQCDPQRSVFTEENFCTSLVQRYMEYDKELLQNMEDEKQDKEDIDEEFVKIFQGDIEQEQMITGHADSPEEAIRHITDKIRDVLEKDGNAKIQKVVIRRLNPKSKDNVPEDDISLRTNKNQAKWKQGLVCLNEIYQDRHPLFGREKELDRTIQVLCRKERNNPLHVGEPGVGKSAIALGLARRIEEGDVPRQLLGMRIYEVDVASLLAGSSLRGEFEQRMKSLLDGAKREGNVIVYIDDIQQLVGAGANSDSPLDGANILKPYLDQGSVRFMGATSYEDFNRFLSKNKGMMRRFQQIDVPELTPEETFLVLQQLKPLYEEYHQVKYGDDALSFIVAASQKHITNRFLPDKAVDLMDETGAFCQLHRDEGVIPQVTVSVVSQVLAKVAKVDALAQHEDDEERLSSLFDRVTAKVYGQDEAVRTVVEAVQMSKAGLLDDNKPLASLLFVGPTGVGKTEVAKVLAQELEVTLLRFDMSEYTEEHSVAKLIGSPAGYVGYDDGGLLTDAIRKSPNCVLLLDEIEKAHDKIYNILLQVMDYGVLTDNKGNKADFRNVVLIMTSNAGAQYAKQANVGFASSVSVGDAMMKQVKKTFKPEFINRLSAIVTFNEMDKTMAELILQKKLRELSDKLSAKKVSMQVSDEAFQELLRQGYTTEYGAREMDRVIASKVKPLLMKEILFGSLKKGGTVRLVVNSEIFRLE